MHEARYKYAQLLYDREYEIKERLEKKAAAVFALPSTLIGAMFLNAEPMNALALFLQQLQGKNNLLYIGMIGIFVAFVVCMIISVAYAIAAIMLQSYQKEYPKQLYHFLARPNARHLQNADAFYEEIAGRLAIATVHNATTNAIKSTRLNYAIIALFLSVMFLLVFLTAFLLQGV